jgi:hypothetical protein
MIVSFSGLGLAVSNISQSVGIFLAVLFGPVSIICLVIALIAQKSFSKDQKEYADKQAEFAKIDFESAFNKPNLTEKQP